MAQVDVTPAVSTAFNDFVKDDNAFTLPLSISSDILEAGNKISYPNGLTSDFKVALNLLQTHLDPKTPLYLIIRRDGKLVAITYVPHRADTELKALFLSNRQALVRSLGEDHFSLSLICKEPAEIYDYRSWEERGSKEAVCNDCADVSCKQVGGVKDLGYQRNKCRLCDQRMKNKITDEARAALRHLDTGGACVQMSLDIPTLTLQLNFTSPNLPADQLASKLPKDHPTYNFYRHPTTSLIYFIYLSPDTAPVKSRMSSIMAIPGLVNIIAESEEGVTVDRKIEIHDPEDLDLDGVVKEGRDGRIGKFRSMYLRNGFEGTESVWEGMEKV
ncbi:hypothetical protein BDV96DRAFT_601926 [Lophiotrema nucula]|uniref:ADF-H domain-containing protein n=1 Tax=Lophiotrema nucula TaxID=690887 RepID=A0A6A5Z296_9PLEO|nr:hypothetical protein BDV96DRAFT_601926 [Lophiotrema nucula]